jgi:tRNA pseudouridine65 synthase
MDTAIDRGAAGNAADAGAAIEGDAGGGHAPLQVLCLDDALVVINKPPGLLVHPTALDAHEQRSALVCLREQLGIPLWTVHRLDKATSGVLMFARSVEAARALGAAFEAGQVHKRYLALVRGWPAEAGEIDHALARDPELPSAGQPRLAALTRYRRLRCHEWPFTDGRHPTSRFAVLDIEPLTGRRHQIRRHFKHIAHPLVGDSTHGKGPLNRQLAAWLGVQRLWLHARWLEVPAFDGRPATVIEAAPGSEWQPLLPQGADPAAGTPSVQRPGQPLRGG